MIFYHKTEHKTINAAVNPDPSIYTDTMPDNWSSWGKKESSEATVKSEEELTIETKNKEE